MIGAIVGDIAGSRFELSEKKPVDFEVFTEECRFTDDSVMTLALAQAILDTNKSSNFYKDFQASVIKSFKDLGRSYPDAGYGRGFKTWLESDETGGYNSMGNGSAMRISPIAYIAKNTEDLIELSRIASSVSHNHPQGIKGGEATAVAVYMAIHGSSKENIKTYIEDNYYSLDFNYQDLVENYKFDSTCQGTVPQAIYIFLISENFEDLIRKALSIGGDSDTIAAIAGSIGGAYYGVDSKIEDKALSYLDERLLAIYRRFKSEYGGTRK